MQRNQYVTAEIHREFLKAFEELAPGKIDESIDNHLSKMKILQMMNIFWFHIYTIK